SASWSELPRAPSRPRPLKRAREALNREAHPVCTGNGSTIHDSTIQCPMSFLDEIEPLKQSALAELKAAADLSALEQAKVNYLGSHGKFTALLKQLGTLSKEERPGAGKLTNQAKVELESVLNERKAELELQASLPKEPTDFTLPGRRRSIGRLHPLTQVTEDIVRSFRKIGFVVADGPEIEDEYHCFDALNTPADHPARDTQDTFYLKTAQR